MTRRATTSVRPAVGTALFAGCLQAGQARADVPVIGWHDQRMTLHALNAERSVVLRDISRGTQTPIDGLDHVTGPISIDLNETSLRSASQALIGNGSDALTEFGRVDDGDPPHCTVRIDGPLPPRPAGLRIPSPGQPGSSEAMALRAPSLPSLPSLPSPLPHIASTASSIAAQPPSTPAVLAPPGGLPPPVSVTAPISPVRPPGPPSGARGQAERPKPSR